MNSTFNNSQQIQGGLNSQLQDITNKGLAGQGFLGNQEAALRSASTQNAAQQNVTAEHALNQRNAGGEEGGAASSGAVAAGNERLATNAAAGNSANQLAITNQNANLARENVSQGLNGLSALSGQVTGQANSLGGQAVGASGQSFNEETQAYQPSNFWSGLATSALGAGVSALTGNVGGLATAALGAFGRGPQGALNRASDNSGNSNIGLQQDDDLGNVGF
jgi:hypothetical protein